MIDYASHALYEGWVWHRRSKAPAHQFRYRISYVFLELDHLAEAFGGRWLWSCAGPAVAWLRRGDHLGDASTPLAEAVRQLVRAEGVDADGPVCLMTQLRYWGFVMNPVSFYFCYAANRRQLRAVVAEVHNTPWGEQHCYVLPLDDSRPGSAWLDKQFHVSPFMPMNQQYRWQVAPPAQRLRLRIENYEREQRQFSAVLNLRRRAWNTLELHRALWLFPLMTQRIFAAIYWQALRLWWKGARYHPHPRPVATAALPSPNTSLEHCECGHPG
jgi:DUF1365 family protein